MCPICRLTDALVKYIMSCNRLRLDFSLITAQERKNFLDEYLAQPLFDKSPPTAEELEMMGNYVLWGKNPETGISLEKEAGLSIDTKHKTWSRDNIESLDELMESPTFNEAALSLNADRAKLYKQKKEVFSREEALSKCSPDMRQAFIDLFREIDKLELSITYYELAHGKRTKEPRAALLAVFTEEEREKMQERVSHWNQYRYLSMRHQLVEMRREQYTMRDSFQQPLFIAENTSYAPAPDTDFDAGIPVLPLGAYHENTQCSLVFRKWPQLIPQNYTDPELSVISRLYWEKMDLAAVAPQKYKRWIDFRNEEHIYQIFAEIGELEAEAAHADVQSNLPALLRTLHFYVDQADLTDIQREILSLKLNKYKNTDIAATINGKHGKTYTPNYISTIFRQRIIPKICEAAAYHVAVVGNLFFPEEFKTCACCGETMLRTTDNFTRKSRSSDGLSPRCKRCEKKARNGEL